VTTGPQHYRAAEESQRKAQSWAERTPGVSSDAAILVEALNGLTSAVLANAAATALGAVGGASYERTAGEWLDTIIPQRVPPPTAMHTVAEALAAGGKRCECVNPDAPPVPPGYPADVARVCFKCKGIVGPNPTEGDPS
jgi:hypothetical protein